MRILVVDDDPDVAAMVAFHLAAGGYQVMTAKSGADAMHAVAAQDVALLVLDLMLPDMSGFDVLARLRESDSTRHIAIVVLTARREEADRLRALALGADDYLTKPFSAQELVLRVGAILRRMQAPRPEVGSNVIEVGTIQIDQAAVAVKVAGRELELTATEYRLLLLLAERCGRVQGRKRLLDVLCGGIPDLHTRTVDMHVKRLRSKLGSAGALIETVRGVGYRLQSTGWSPAG